MFPFGPGGGTQPEDCAGDNQRMVGRVADKRTGVCIDIFAYGMVEELRPWQKDPRYKEVTWWERRNDHADFGPGFGGFNMF